MGNYYKGFFINICDVNNISLFNRDSIYTVKSDIDCCIQFDDHIINFSNKTNIKVFISGEITQLENYDDIEECINDIILSNDFKLLNCIHGDYILAIISFNSVIIYNSFESQDELFWQYESNNFIASNYSWLIKNTVVDKFLPLLCYGEPVNIFSNNVLKRNQVLVFSFGNIKIFSLDTPQKFNPLMLKKLKIQELSEISYNLLKNSVKVKTHNHSKLGVMLSGGIDSSSIVRCLYDLNKEVTLFTWCSRNKRLDEGRYSTELSKLFGYKIEKIFVEDMGLLPEKTALFFPYTHAVSIWWEYACKKAQEHKIKMLLSGHFAHYYDEEFSLKNYRTIREKIIAAINANANPYFRFTPSKNFIYKEENLFRKIDIFTNSAKEIILNYWNNKLDYNTMQTQEYSYKINIFMPNKLLHVSPFLDHNVISFCNSLPKKYKNTFYEGQTVNKIILRYSMLNKLPHKIVSRCYPANLGYMAEKNLKNFFGENPNYFREDSILVKKGIIDLQKYRHIVENGNIGAYRDSIATSILVESWLKIFLR